MSTLKVNNIEASTGSEIDINSTLGTIPSIVVSGVTTVAAGSASAPSITPTGDSNTGIFFPSADTIAFGEGGVEALRIDSSGRVGIGTDSPAVKTHISDSVVSVGATGTEILRVANTRVNTSSSAVALRFVNNEISGTNQYTRAQIAAELDTPGTNDNTGRLMFATTDTSGVLQERARIDSSGRLLLGTTTARTGYFGNTPEVQIEAAKASDSVRFGLCNNSNGVQDSQIILAKTRGTSVGSNTIVQNGDTLGRIAFVGADGTDLEVAAQILSQVDGTPGSNDMPGRLVFSTTADGASSPTERMRIANTGQVLVNTTSTLPHFIFNLRANSDGTYNPMVIQEDAASGSPARVAINFYRTSASASVGNISTTNSATSYNTSSDYRLKINVVPVIDGIARLQQLKPSRFNFIASPNCVVDGFIAHEVQDVVPEAIHGSKDEVDADGNPIYQGIDQSKLVPLLTAALQEAVAKIESLEARLDAANL